MQVRRIKKTMRARSSCIAGWFGDVRSEINTIQGALHHQHDCHVEKQYEITFEISVKEIAE